MTKTGSRRRPATVREYERCLNSYVLPALGCIRLRTLKTTHVEDVLDEMHAKGLSASSLTNAKKALSAALSDAVKDRVIGINVASKARLPENAPSAKKVVIPPVEGLRELLEATTGSELGRILMVLVYTGARIGEVLGTTWSDFDLDECVWTIHRTTTLDRQGRTVLGLRTKTGESRKVPLNSVVIGLLKEQRKGNARSRLKAFTWTDLDLVFPSEVGTPIDTRNLRKRLNHAAKDTSFTGSFHSFRHFVASVGLATTTEHQVAKMLGHANSRTTRDVYGHLVNSVAVEVQAGIQGQLGTIGG